MSFYDAKTFLINNQVQCFKYNYSLDACVQNKTYYEAILNLSSDGQYFEIINCKPILSEKKAEEQKKITKAYQYYMKPPNEAEANQ